MWQPPVSYRTQIQTHATPDVLNSNLCDLRGWYDSYSNLEASNFAAPRLPISTARSRCCAHGRIYRVLLRIHGTWASLTCSFPIFFNTCESATVLALALFCCEWKYPLGNHKLHIPIQIHQVAHTIHPPSTPPTLPAFVPWSMTIWMITKITNDWMLWLHPSYLACVDVSLCHPVHTSHRSHLPDSRCSIRPTPINFPPISHFGPGVSSRMTFPPFQLTLHGYRVLSCKPSCHNIKICVKVIPVLN